VNRCVPEIHPPTVPKVVPVRPFRHRLLGLTYGMSFMRMGGGGCRCPKLRARMSALLCLTSKPAVEPRSRLRMSTTSDVLCMTVPAAIGMVDIDKMRPFYADERAPPNCIKARARAWSTTFLRPPMTLWISPVARLAHVLRRQAPRRDTGGLNSPPSGCARLRTLAFHACQRVFVKWVIHFTAQSRTAPLLLGVSGRQHHNWWGSAAAFGRLGQ